MNKKYVFRLRNADLFDVDEMRIERLAKKGWLPRSMSRSLFTFTRGEPRDIKCRLLFYDTADPSYNTKMTKLQNEGWEYVSSDGISQTMLIADADGSAPDILEPEAEIKVVKRHRFAQGITAFACFAALVLLLPKTIADHGGLPLNRVFIYAAVLLFGIQCVCCCVSHTRNLITVTGEAGPRKTMRAHWFHAALTAAACVLLVLALIMALCYNK